MLKIAIMAVLISGCAAREYRQVTDQVGEYGVQAIEDKKTGVVCFVYRDGDWSALSCVREK